MKKKTGTSLSKLSLNKKRITRLEETQRIVGGESQASECYSCMSECLCDPPPPPSGGTGSPVSVYGAPCCPINIQ